MGIFEPFGSRQRDATAHQYTAAGLCLTRVLFSLAGNLDRTLRHGEHL